VPKPWPILPTIVAASVLLAGTASAEAPKVWTKEDLERRFGPSEVSRPVAVDPEGAARDRAFVEAFLERHDRILQAEREYAMRREAAREEAAPPEREYSLGYAPWSVYGAWAVFHRRGHPGARPAPHREDPPHRYARDVNPMGGRVKRSAAEVNPANRR
jgi:hypothetical protein